MADECEMIRMQPKKNQNETSITLQLFLDKEVIEEGGTDALEFD